MTVSSRIIAEGSRGHQLRQQWVITFKHFRAVARNLGGLGKHRTDAWGGEEGFSTFMASHWLQRLIRSSDWLLLMLCGANRESCNRKLKHQQRLTYLAKTAAHYAAEQSAVLFPLFIGTLLKPRCTETVSLIVNHNKSSQDQKHSDKIFLEENKWSAKYLDIIY